MIILIPYNLHVPLKYGLNRRQEIILAYAVTCKTGEYGRSFATCLNCCSQNKVFEGGKCDVCLVSSYCLS